jgi:hypothetical protein
MSQNQYAGIQHTVHLSSDVDKGCDECHKFISGFAEAINHYLQLHDYRLLHVGTETVRDDEGRPHHTTVAVVGKQR